MMMIIDSLSSPASSAGPAAAAPGCSEVSGVGDYSYRTRLIPHWRLRVRITFSTVIEYK